MMALARKIVSGDDDAETVEQVFRGGKGTPRPTPRKLLVDDAWKAVEGQWQRVTRSNGNGHHDNSNGHHVDGIGPTVELVQGNGHANG